MDRWRVWNADEVDGEEEARCFPVTGQYQPWLGDSRIVAEHWAMLEDQESAEYSIVAQRSEPTVIVEDLITGERSRWLIEGESIPSYTASSIPIEGVIK